MKNCTLKLISILALVLASSAAFATCTTGGNQCGVETQTPAITWDKTAGIQIGGETGILGKAMSGSDGIGQTKLSKAWTYTEGSANIETKTSLTADNLENCTKCGDNQVGFKLTGMQSSLAGAANETSTTGGAAQSLSESAAGSELSAYSWGRMGGIKK